MIERLCLQFFLFLGMMMKMDRGPRNMIFNQSDVNVLEYVQIVISYYQIDQLKGFYLIP